MASTNSLGDASADPPLAGTAVLVVEDEAEVAAVCAEFLEYAGAKVRVAHSLRTGLEAALADLPDVIVCDLDLGDSHCIERGRSAGTSSQ